VKFFILLNSSLIILSFMSEYLGRFLGCYHENKSNEGPKK